MFCLHGLGAAHILVDLALAFPFIAGFVFYLKAKIQSRKKIHKIKTEDLLFTGPAPKFSLKDIRYKSKK